MQSLLVHAQAAALGAEVWMADTMEALAQRHDLPCLVCVEEQQHPGRHSHPAPQIECGDACNIV